MYFGAGRTLLKVSLDTTKEVIPEVMLTLEDAAVAATETDSFLLFEGPYNRASAEDIDKLKSLINNQARVKTTRSIFSNPVVKANYGELQLINLGESVQFSRQGSKFPFLECDGLIKTSTSALLNEVKASPKMEDVDDVLDRAGKLLQILRKPYLYVSKPSNALEELNGLQRVVPFLSGCDFSREVVNKCSLLGVNTVETNGSDNSVRLYFPSDS
jgi:hypothetical protein